MTQKLELWLQEIRKKHSRTRIWKRVLSFLMAVTVFSTTYALILPAITMDGIYCGIEEHTHSVEDGCYTEHKTLICTQEEGGHAHTDACYEEQRSLTCTAEEAEGHAHGEECHDEEGGLICTLEESDGHQHSEDCYQTEKVLVCGQEEAETNTHVHTDACYETTLEMTCEKDEHQHTKACYSNPEADVETAAVWESSFNNVGLTGVWADDVLAIAGSQLGYTESVNNYQVEEDGTVKGYTRYGAWYGSPYGDWCAMFVSFCLNYAQVDMPIEANCPQWTEKLNAQGLYHAAGNVDAYMPKKGDLIFFDWDNDGAANHVGLVYELIKNENGDAAQVKTIEGDSGDAVRINTYNLTDSTILGYGELPENPAAVTASNSFLFETPQKSGGAVEDYVLGLKWIAYDNLPGTKSDTDLSLLGWNSRTKKYINAQVTFSNSVDYNVNDVQIRIPAELLRYRTGKPLNGAGCVFGSIGVPKAPAMSQISDFNYTIDDDTGDVILTNCKTIRAGGNNLIQIAWPVDAMGVVDEEDFGFAAKLTINGEEQPDSNTITGRIDTSARVTGASKVVFSPETLSWTDVQKYVPALSGSDKPQDFDDYWYYVYDVKYYPEFSQPYNVVLTEIPGADGELVGGGNPRGYQGKGGPWYFDPDTGTLTGSSDSLLYLASDKYLDTMTYSASGALFENHIYTVVRFPKDKYPAGTRAENTIKVELTGVDDGITSTAQATVSTPIIAWNIAVPPGELYSAEKDVATNALSHSAAAIKSAMVSGEDYVFPYGRGFRVTTTGRKYTDARNIPSPENSRMNIVAEDGIVKADNIELGPDDYYITALEVNLWDKLWLVDESEHISDFSSYVSSTGNPVKLYVQTRDNPGVWQTAGEIPYENFIKPDEENTGYSVMALHPYDSIDAMPYVSETLKAQGIYKVKAEHESDSSHGYESGLRLYVKMSIRHDSHVLRQLVDNILMSGNYITVENYSSHNIFLNEGEVYDETRRASVYFTPASVENEFEKYMSVVSDDPQNGVVNLKVSLYCTQTLKGGSSYETVKSLIDSGLSLEQIGWTQKDWVLYDLLPEGHMFDPNVPFTVVSRASNHHVIRNTNTETHFFASDDISITSYEIIDNYRNSGRTMVKLNVHTDFNMNPTDPANEDIYMQFGVYFSTYVRYADLKKGINIENDAAWQPQDGEFMCRRYGRWAAPDSGSWAPRGVGKDINDVSYFYDLNENGDADEENTLYASNAITINTAVATATGLIKTVRADADSLAAYSEEARVATDETYTYRLKVQNSDGGTMKNVIVFDRLERAAIDRAGMDGIDFDEAYWQGTLESVDVSLPVRKGIAPVVYYSTKTDAAYDLSDAASAWTTQKPADMSTVKAIAVDLSKRADGTDYVFGKLEGTYISLNMRAPSTLTESVIHAYNNPAWFNEFTASTGETKTETTLGTAVIVELYESAELRVSKRTNGIETDEIEFSFKVLQNGKPYGPIEYKLYDISDPGAPAEVPGTWITSAEGIFKLKHNQMAVFDRMLNNASYSVTELEAEGNTIVSPAGGVVTGTLDKNNPQIAEFVNEYYGNKVKLRFKKTVPQNNAVIAAPEDDLFEFTVKIGKTADTIAPYANQAYKLYDPDGTEITEGSPFMTDADGKLYLKAGQTAEFSQLLKGWHFSITETPTQDYKCTSPYNGTASGRLTTYGTADTINFEFVNRFQPYRTLTVEKKVTAAPGEQAPPMDDFTFTVKLDGNLTKYRAYKLYDISDPTAPVEQQGVYRTDGNGQLKLKANQRAVFEGLLAGTNYEVTEEAKNEYETTGADTDGQIPLDAEGAAARFVNHYKSRHTLIVSKTVANAPADFAETFEFTVDIVNGQDRFVPADGTYSVVDKDGNTVQRTVTKAQDGRLTVSLGNGEKLVVTAIPVGYTANVMEAANNRYIASYIIDPEFNIIQLPILLPENRTVTQVMDTNHEIAVINEKALTEITVNKTVVGGGKGSFSFRLEFDDPTAVQSILEFVRLPDLPDPPDFPGIHLKGVYTPGMSTDLSDAAQPASEDDGTAPDLRGAPDIDVSGPKVDIDTPDVDVSGPTVDIDTPDIDVSGPTVNADAGTAPSYRAENGAIVFELKDGEQITIPGIPVGTKVTITETSHDGYTVSIYDITAGRTLIKDGDTAEITLDAAMRIEVQNNPGVALPHTGGIGTHIYTIGGLLLMFAAAVVSVFGKKRGREAGCE